MKGRTMLLWNISSRKAGVPYDATAGLTDGALAGLFEKMQDLGF